MYCIVLYCCSSRVPQDHTKKHLVRRCWGQFDPDRFIEDLENSPLVCDLTGDDDVTEMFNRYDKTLLSLLEVHAPAKTLHVRAARSAPWYDADCREVKKETRRLEKLYRLSMAAADRLCWISSFSHQRQVFQQKLSGYGISAIDSCNNDARALWRKVHTLMTPPPPQSDSSSLSADDFAVHFDSRRRLTRFALQRPVHPHQKSTPDQLKQHRCRASEQSMLPRSNVCCHVSQLSTVSLILCRPDLSNVLQQCLHQSLVGCAMRLFALQFFQTHTKMPSSSLT